MACSSITMVSGGHLLPALLYQKTPPCRIRIDMLYCFPTVEDGRRGHQQCAWNIRERNLLPRSWSRENPRKKIYADEMIARGKKHQDVWEFKDPVYPAYPTEKNLDMLKMILRASSHPTDLVLDCFAGSGTTLVAAETTGRRWIGIDNSEAAIEICRRRLRDLGECSAYVLYNVEGPSERVGKEKQWWSSKCPISGCPENLSGGYRSSFGSSGARWCGLDS